MKLRDKLILFLIAITVFSFVVYQLSAVLMPFIFSFIVAYFLRPLVNYFADKKIPDGLAVFFIMIIFFTIIGAILWLILPIIYQQSGLFLAEIPSYLQIFKTEIYPKYLAFLHRNGIKFNGNFEQLINNYNSELLNFAKNFTLKIFSSTGSIINILSLIFIMPILIFYLLKDWNILTKKFNEYLPKKSAVKVHKNLNDIDHALSGYIRGQALVCVIMALIYASLLSFTGLNFGFLIGFLTGIFSFIPYVGALTGFVVAISTAGFQWGFDIVNLSQVIIAIIIGQVIESNYLTPKLIGERVGLHPVWVIFGIFIFGSIFGVMGVIFATPLTAVFGVVIKNLANEYKKRFV